ncbi:HupE/UreJ family protein [Novosphingobium sp. SG720]|uniref:HupE/UreJ family protein n=1 Tax=Novosphingobium sp. SG720 TaxID=2586998 RepID=UPI001446A5BA|nr:HupE/UreJ family protein [Novosphingobium sp. SG720]NKJ44526.1 hypothetical protein [Novosphingobium sp. SG720]
MHHRCESGGERTPSRLLWFLFAFLVLALSAGVLSAHPMPDSQVSVRIQAHHWRVHLVLPNDRLAMALIATGGVPDPGPGFTAYPALPHPAIAHYVVHNMHLHTPNGADWPLRVVGIAGPAGPRLEWTVDVDATVPLGLDPRTAVLDYDVIIRHVIPDAAIVALDQDWGGGVLPGEPVLLGKLSEDQRSIAIARHDGGSWQALGGMVVLGLWHILEGADHIAFLLTLLLTVGLVAQGQRWAVAPGRRRVLHDVLWRVSAFTAGHTLSLLATSLGLLPQAGRTIEVLIALSVAISAAHALVPLFPRREAWIAGGFGLVHGMAFATAIRDLGLSTGQTVAATLAFNLGIELAQLGIVAIALPTLLLLRPTAAGPWVRHALGAGALVLALVWMAQRITI